MGDQQCLRGGLIEQLGLTVGSMGPAGNAVDLAGDQILNDMFLVGIPAGISTSVFTPRSAPAL